MRKVTVVDYEWDIKIDYVLRCRTKNGIGIDAITDIGTRFQTTKKCSWRSFKKSLKYNF